MKLDTELEYWIPPCWLYSISGPNVNFNYSNSD